MPCILSHPPLPEMAIKTRKGNQQKIQVHIRNKSQFGILKYNPDGTIVEEIHKLPHRPSECPTWEHALAIPAKSGEHQALIFLLGTHRWLWLFESRSHLGWKKTNHPLFKTLVLAALATNPAPHKKFLEECLLALAIHQGKTGEIEEIENTVLAPNNWPPLLHLRWLEILYDITTQKTPIGHATFILPTEEYELKALLKNLRRGTIVSMALRCTEELALAQRFLTEKTQQEPKDNTWNALLELIQ